MEGEDLSRAPMAPESESLPYRLVNTNTIEITIYTYELEKHFKDGGKTHFMSSDIYGIHVEFRTYITFGDNFSILYNE